jgi:hypothetical protein
LSDEGDGLPKYMRLADGTLIDTKTGQKSVDTEINRAFSDEPQRSLLRAPKVKYGPGHRRFLDDLPLPPDQCRGVAAVLAFHLFGLSNADIAHIAKIRVESIDAILAGDASTRMLDGILQNIREHDRDVVRKKINAAAQDAVSKIVSLVESGDEKVSLSAAKDILDRSRHDSDDAGNRLTASGLTIRIIDERDSPTAKIDVSIEE